MPDQQQWLARWTATLHRLAGAMNRNLTRRSTSQEWLVGRLRQAHPGVRLLHQVQRLDDLEQRLALSARRWLERSSARLHRQTARLSGFSPPHPDSQTVEQVCGISAAPESRSASPRGRSQGASRSCDASAEWGEPARYAGTRATPSRFAARMDRLLRPASEVRSGEDIEARLSKGRVIARVKDRQGMIERSLASVTCALGALVLACADAAPELPQASASARRPGDPSMSAPLPPRFPRFTTTTIG